MKDSAAVSVLIVDDDLMIRECLVAFLEDEGYQVKACSRAEDALKAIAENPPAVCLTDMRLPGMNGEELIRTVRAVAPGVRFLIHTGGCYELPDDLVEAGMNAEDVLLKPIHDLSRLARLVSARAGMLRE